MHAAALLRKTIQIFGVSTEEYLTSIVSDNVKTITAIIGHSDGLQLLSLETEGMT